MIICSNRKLQIIALVGAFLGNPYLESLLQEALRPNKPRCNFNSRTRNGDFGPHNWNTPKSTLNEHVKQYMAQHSHVVKQSHSETVQVISLLIQIKPIMPIYRCWFSICTAVETVKQSAYNHRNRPRIVSQSKYIRRQLEFWPIWGPKMTHTFFTRLQQ